jgi:dihydrofolate reductase
MNNLPKIVFSKTLQKVEWNNSRLVKENIGEEISKMKQQPGKDMVIFGSGSIVSTLMQLALIDEYRIIVNPVVLGNGNPLFKGISDKHNLKLLKTKVLCSGVVILYYQQGGLFSTEFSFRHQHILFYAVNTFGFFVELFSF